MAPLMSKKQLWFLILGLLSLAVVGVIVILAYLLLTLPVPATGIPPATPTRPVLTLPTAPLPATTPGLRRPLQVKFVPQEPIKGFPNCNIYGFQGKVNGTNNIPLADIQVVVWRDEAGGLLALATTDKNGAYSIQIRAKPAQRDLWVQLYQDDSPVSDPLLTKTQIDCQNGFQFFQINWQALPASEKSN